MDVMTTSGTTGVAHANSLRGEWGRFWAFLKRPVLPAMAPYPRAASLVAVLRLLGLDFLIMAVLLSIAGLVAAAGVSIPQTAIAGMDMSPAVIAAAILAAPLAEEIVFRSWLSGRLWHILGLLAAIVAGSAVMAWKFATSPGTDGMGAFGDAALFAVPVGLIAALAVIYPMRGRPAMGWFQRAFPVFFWLSALAFAAAHLLNFTEANMLAILPLVLPQFTIGLVLGYARVTYGLWSSVLLHVLHNAAFMGMVLAASQLA